MLDLIWLVPALPLLGFVILFATRGRLPKPAVATVGVGSVGIAFAFAALVTYAFLSAPPAHHAYQETLWTWINVDGFAPTIGFYVDALSLVMMLVVTGVGFLIHLYSSEFMDEDDGYNRYFAYLNLFLASMLVLVLADNLLFLFLGWEGVGLCSYLLIGFWYRDPANGLAARKAFVVTRAGDVAMTIGLFFLFHHLGTLNIQELMARAAQGWPVGSALAVTASALLLGGALGKSAQLPLQTWLPDAMAGPTPVSALIHAATMVTAGVYLIARTHVLFTLAPQVQLAVAAIGATTLVLASFSALPQRDIKRVLAYSTISQIGYMFLALGVGAWWAGIFHFMMHAFFKALLFLAAGSVIMTFEHEHDIFRMGGLRRDMPITFWTFVIASASLAALPLITAGFYSKDTILWYAWSAPNGSPWLWGAGLLGALLTAIYIFRVVFVAFVGEPHEERPPAGRKAGWRMNFAMIALALLSLIGGFLDIPETLGNVPLLSHFLDTALPPAVATHGGLTTETALQIVSALTAVGGLAVAWFCYRLVPGLVREAASTPLGALLHRFWFAGWGFDWVYDRVFVRPFLYVAHLNRHDFVDAFYDGVAFFVRMLHLVFKSSQSGLVRRYAAGIAFGCVVVVAIAIFV